MSRSPVPALLKEQNSVIDESLEMAFTYLQAYKDTGDWGFLPTVEHCVARITKIHMLRANKLLKGESDGASSTAV